MARNNGGRLRRFLSQPVSAEAWRRIHPIAIAVSITIVGIGLAASALTRRIWVGVVVVGVILALVLLMVVALAVLSAVWGITSSTASRELSGPSNREAVNKRRILRRSLTVSGILVIALMIALVISHSWLLLSFAVLVALALITAWTISMQKGHQ